MGSLSAHARPTYRPETSQPRLGEKPPPGGLPRFFQSSSVTPLRMEEKGDLRSGGFGPEGSGVCLHVRQVPAHRAQVFEPRGGRRLLIAGCKCPAGSRKGMGTPGRHRAPGPERVPWKIPRPGPRYPSLSLAHCLCGAESAAGQCGLGEMARCSEWQGGLLFPRTGAQGPSETAVTSQGRVT